ANAGLRRRLEAAGVDQPASGKAPRWEWALEDLLADREWWAMWLPRLNELLGREVRPYGLPAADKLDTRGYVDLMTMLFPTVQLKGRLVAPWSSPAYPHHLRGGHEAEQSRQQPHLTAAPLTTAAAWEPVVRHVATALCAIEQTCVPGADPVLRIRTEDELAGS